MLAAKQPLVVPMLLRLSQFRLNSYVVLVVSRQKGITLVFKTDPLQNVDINSTFDSIAVIQKFIQREIEGQLRQMFREDLPGIIHRLSQQWVKAKVEAPYLAKQPTAPAAPGGIARSRSYDAASTPGPSSLRFTRVPPAGFVGSLPRRPSSAVPFTRPRSPSARSVSSTGKRPASLLITSPVSRPPSQTPSPLQLHHPHHPDGPTSFPDIEHYDPTYGLRPEGLPSKGTFGGFRNLFARNKGLADLAEESTDVDSQDEAESFDPGTWEDFLSDGNVGPSVSEAGDVTEYETVPAVGGGTITRPRVYHSQAQIHVAPDGDASSSLSTAQPILLSRSGSLQSIARTPSRPGSLYNPYFAGMTPVYESLPDLHPFYPESIASSIRQPQPMPPVPALDPSTYRRPGSPSSLHTQPSRSSHSVATPTPPDEDAAPSVRITRPRRLSTASSNLDSFSASDLGGAEHGGGAADPKIVLRPALNGSVSKLSTLSHSNHTLSPYTRTVEHFTVRSVPPREVSAAGHHAAATVERQPVRARRKRLHRLGGAAKKPAPPPEGDGEDDEDDGLSVRSSHGDCAPPSDFDASEMDRYFRARDDLIPRYPSLHPSHVRRRVPHPS